MFAAGATINQSLGIGNSVVTLNTIYNGINDNGCFNVGNNTYVCSKAGRMLLQAQVTVMNLSGTGSICSLTFVIDGADVAPKLNTVPPNYSNVTFANSLIADVNLGTTIWLKFYNDASPDIRTRAADWGVLSTSLQGFYLT